MTRRFLDRNRQLFKNWPVINYNGTQIQRFQSKITIVDVLKKNPTYTTTYTLGFMDKRPDIVSKKLYGVSDYDWLILTLNKTIDPFFDWPMDSLVFEQYINDKYKTTTMSGFTYARQTIFNYIQIDNLPNISTNQYVNLPPELQKYWLPFDNNDETIGYKYNFSNYEISKEGYDLFTAQEKQYWIAQTYYMYESTKNNNNKIIFVVRPEYISTIVNQHSRLIRV